MNQLSNLDSLKPVRYQIGNNQIEISNPESSAGFGEYAEVSLKKIIEYLKRDVKFQYTVFTLMGFSVGKGFNNTTNTKIPSGRKCLELLNDFTEYWDLDALNQSMAINGWASGNGFLNTPGTAENIDGLYEIPLSSIRDIKRDQDGTVTNYIQQTATSYDNKIEPDQVAHFKWLPIDGSAFGEGIGQALARKGHGYRTSSGNIVRRPSYFEMGEIMTDVNVKMYYSGQSRYLITPDSDETLDKKYEQALKKGFDKLDPLGHIISPKKIKVQEIALSSESKFNTVSDRFDKEFSVGTKTPLIELISSMNFSYASSQTALATVFPLLESFQRAYKKFIETKIYRPLILQENKDPKIIDPRINWGSPEKLTVEDIKLIQDILNTGSLSLEHDPQDVLDMLSEAGVPLPNTDKLSTQSTNKIQFVHKLESTLGSKEKLQNLIAAEKEKLAKGNS